MELSKRAREIRPSLTLALNQKAKALRAEGKSIVNLTAGEPDFPTPVRICDKAKYAMDQGETRYTAASGIPELKDAISRRVEKVYHRTYGPSEVLVSVGAKHAIFNLCLALLDKGDEALILSPYWISYSAMVEIAGATPVISQTRVENNFLPDVEEIERQLNQRTKLLILNSPNNPTGAVYNHDILSQLARLVSRHPNLVLATDDIYEHFVFDGRNFESVAMLPEMPSDQVVIIGGVSKTYSMTGWRIGYACGPKPLLEAMSAMQSQSTSNPTSISQWAAVEALSGHGEEIEIMRKTFEGRRDFVLQEFNRVPNIQVQKPGGAFYVFPQVKAFFGKKTTDGTRIESDGDLATYLLSSHGLAVVPGSAFGAEGFLRLSYAASEKDLKEGMKRLAHGLKELC